MSNARSSQEPGGTRTEDDRASSSSNDDADCQHGRPSCTTHDTSIADDWNYEEVARVRFDVIRNAFYHTARERSFEFRSRVLLFLIVVLGTAGATKIFEDYVGRDYLAFLTALIAAFDLVTDFRGKARVHENLRRRYYELLAEIDGTEHLTRQLVRSWRSKLASITADEPTTFRAVDAIAYNEAADSTGADVKLDINVFTRLFANLYAFPGHSFQFKREKSDE